MPRGESLPHDEKANDDYEVCIKCGIARIPKGETEEHGRWVCDGPECEPLRYTMDLLDWISTRIAVTTSEDDDMSRFVFRELVQNADDVESTIVVVRFVRDALEVANDGFGFRSSVGGKLGDFQRIALVLRRHQEDDPRTTGKFGTGFQTVYNLTNRPEIHSNGKSIRMDPTLVGEEERMMRLPPDERRKSPYMPKGVLFRFPWRDDHEAEMARGAEYRPFIDSDKWPRWDAAGRRKLYEDLVRYLHDVLLCCRHLKRIRLLWEAEGSKTGYQAERDFTLLPGKDGDKTVYTSVGRILEGAGSGGYQSWEWKGEPRTARYVIGSKQAAWNKPTFMLKRKDGTRFVGPMEEGAKKILESDVHILIPLFPASLHDPDKRPRFLYSVMPLPRRGGCNFVVSACFVPVEARNDIKVTGPAKPWTELIFHNMAELYRTGFPIFVKHLQQSKTSDTDKQQAVLDALPPGTLYGWLNKELAQADHLVPLKEMEAVIDVIVNQEMLLVSRDWVKPIEARWMEVPAGREVLRRMGIPCLTESFVSHIRFGTLANALEDRKLTDLEFLRLWKYFVLKEVGRDGLLKYGKREKGVLDFEFVKHLIEFCLTAGNQDVRELAIIPDQNGNLTSVKDFVRPPEGHQLLLDLLPRRARVHADFAALVGDRVTRQATPRVLFEGMKESPATAENRLELLQELYDFLEKCGGKPYDFAIPSDKEIAANEYPVVPDSTGKLRVPSQVALAPVELYDRTVKLFGQAGTSLRWAKKEYVEKHTMLLQALGVKRPPYHVLIEKLDWSQGSLGTPERLILAEGMLNTRPPSELRRIRFLSCGGLLREPSRALLGSTGDKEIDALVGAIDGHVIDNLRKLNLLPTLRECGAADVSPADVVRVISDLAADNPERFDEMEETDFRAVSKAVGWLCKQAFAPTRDTLEMRFLPVRYEGRITLAKPPQWRGSRRPEDYQRDWVFLPSVGAVTGLTPELAAKVKTLHFHPDARIDAKELKRIFTVQALREVTSLNFMQRFVANFPAIGQRSLFYDDELTRFLGAREEKLLERQKKALLKAVREYFSGGPVTNPGLEKDKIGEVPLLYDPSGKWFPPKDTTIGMDETLRSLGVQSLHPDFADWPEKVLDAIGVPQSVPPGAIVKEVQKLARARRRADLGNILLYVLTSEIPIGLEFSALRKEAWIPAGDKDILLPAQVVLPSKSNEGVLGSKDLPFRRFLDYRAASSEFQADSLRRTKERPQTADKVKFRAGNLGMIIEPELDLLLDVFREQVRMNAAPPPELLNRLASVAIAKDDASLRKENWSNLKYWHHNRWWPPDRIFITDRARIPEKLRADYLVLSAVGSHERLLLLLGAKEEPSIDQLLDWITVAAGGEVKTIWRQIVAGRNRITQELSRKFQKLPVCPVDESTRRPPASLVLSPHRFKGECGDLYVIAESHLDADELETLKSLGARSIQSLSSPELTGLLAAIRVSPDGHIEDQDAEFMMHVLAECAEKNVKGMAIPVPCAKLSLGRRRYVKTKLRDAYLPDHQAWSLFEDEIPFFVVASDNSAGSLPAAKIVEWARANGLRSLNRDIEAKVQRKEKDAARDPEQEIRFNQIGRYLERLFASRRDRSGSFEWLKNVEVKRLPVLRETYTVPGLASRARSLAVYLSVVDHAPKTLYIPRLGPSRFYDEIARAVLEACFGGPGAMVSRPDLSDYLPEVRYLLTQPPEEWGRRLAGYKYDRTESIEDLLVIYEEADEEYYHETREKLSDWYAGCQICLQQTPWGEGGIESMENIKSVVSLRGGRYHGKGQFGTQNALWLCPLHQTLYERKLVKIRVLEDEDLDLVQKMLKNVLKSRESAHRKSDYEVMKDFCEVLTKPKLFEDETFKDYKEIEGKTMVFHIDHLQQMLEWFSRYLEAKAAE